MKKGFTVLISLCFCLFTLAACGAKGVHAQVSEELGIDVSKGREISNYDSHGGFHGDGTTCIVFEFDEGTVLEEVKSNPAWKAFPLDETVQTLVYGTADENGQIGPYLTKDSERDELFTELLVPEIRNGYYLLVDRQEEPGMAAGADILHRGSFNFTLGLYDTDTDTLYFCKLDT